MNTKGMFYTNVNDYETKEDMMNDFIALRMYDMAKGKENERLHSIIKEVREYINNHQLVFEVSSKKQIAYWFDMFYKELLEILDKGE